MSSDHSWPFTTQTGDGRSRPRNQSLMPLDQFTLQGTSYRQEYRRCNNPNCHCHHPGQDGHGPYWYARGSTAKRRYIGKALPAHISTTLARHRARTDEMLRLRTRLAAELDAVQALIANLDLHDDHKTTLAELGYADCLVPDPTS